MKKLFLVILSTIIILAFLLTREFVWENQIQDFYLKKFSNKKASADIVLVVIDDKSTEAVRFPWPRNMYAEIFEYLQDYGKASIIVYDAVINAKDVYNEKADEYLFNKLPHFKNLVVGFNLNYDMEKTVHENQRQREKIFNEKFGVKIKDLRKDKFYTNPDNRGFSSFPGEYLKNIKYLGYVGVMTDGDGVVRTYLPLADYNENLYPSLALAAYSRITEVKNFELKDKYFCSADECKTLKMPVKNKKITVMEEEPCKGEDCKNINTTVKKQQYMITSTLPDWYELSNNLAYSHKMYSAIDVVSSMAAIKKGEKPLLDAEIFKNKIVFVGGCANNELIKDKKPTPISPSQAGVDIQATALDNMLSNNFLKKIPVWQNLLVILLMGWITFFTIKKSSIRVSLLISVLLLTLYYLIYTLIFLKYRALALLLTPVITQILVHATGYSYQFFKEGQHKQKIQHAMGKYISKDIMKSVVKNIDNVRLGGKRADITVLFIDIRGFTSISEKLSPEEVTEILNEYFGEVEPIIRQHKGVINKFIGDAVMAIFGEPIQDKYHTQNAVKCANQVLKRIKSLQAKWMEEGKPKIEIGVGINTGEAFVGNIGSEERLEYTVIGDVVNIASRIESFNKIYRTRFLISHDTYVKVRDLVDVILIKDVTIRGKSQKVSIYEVLRLRT